MFVLCCVMNLTFIIMHFVPVNCLNWDIHFIQLKGVVIKVLSYEAMTLMHGTDVLGSLISDLNMYSRDPCSAIM